MYLYHVPNIIATFSSVENCIFPNEYFFFFTGTVGINIERECSHQMWTEVIILGHEGHIFQLYHRDGNLAGGHRGDTTALRGY